MDAGELQGLAGALNDAGLTHREIRQSVQILIDTYNITGVTAQQIIDELAAPAPEPPAVDEAEVEEAGEGEDESQE